LILSYLASSPEKKVPFNEIKDSLELTAGNLSVQLKNLEEAGYIKIYKKIKDNKPETSISLTADGVSALMDYLQQMESLIKKVKMARED
jgi:DNA-binding MarR family transcriptional regulator